MNWKFLGIILILSLALSVSFAFAENSTDTLEAKGAGDKLSSTQNDILGDNAGTVTKVWVDNNDAAGKRPSSVKFTLSIRGGYYRRV